MSSKNHHLLTSILILLPVLCAYGIAPRTVLPLILDFTPSTTDQLQVFRAIMGLYAGMAVFWGIGIWKPVYWRAATLSNMLFMGGLATGRLLSIAIDGIPSPALWVGCVAELVLAAWGWVNLRGTSV